MRLRLLASVAVALLAGCTSGPTDATASPTPVATPTTDAATPQPAPPSPDAGVPALAEAPAGDVTLWLDTIGVPVVAAVRTSTPLAELGDLAAGERTTTCRQVATDLDGIAPPEVLIGLAITADAETATLLVGDLQAKGDLLAACESDGPELDERIAEVERTHRVAVAWLARLRGDQ